MSAPVVSQQPSSYEAMIGDDKWPVWVERWRRCDQDLTPGWLRIALREAQNQVGPIPRETLCRAAARAMSRYERASRAFEANEKAISFPQSFARNLLVSALREVMEE